MDHLFVYGTLMFPEVHESVTGKRFSSIAAVLEDHVRVQVRDAFYPAILESTGDQVQGIVLENVDELSLQQIARYEGPEYILKRVVVKISGGEVNALVFLWSESRSLLDDQDWDVDHFRRNISEFDF